MSDLRFAAALRYRCWLSPKLTPMVNPCYLFHQKQFLVGVGRFQHNWWWTIFSWRSHLRHQRSPGSSGSSKKPDEPGDFSSSNPSVTDLVTSVTSRNPSSSKIGYEQDADNTDVSAFPKSHVTNVTTCFEE